MDVGWSFAPSIGKVPETEVEMDVGWFVEQSIEDACDGQESQEEE